MGAVGLQHFGLQDDTLVHRFGTSIVNDVGSAVDFIIGTLSGVGGRGVGDYTFLKGPCWVLSPSAVDFRMGYVGFMAAYKLLRLGF